MIATPRNPIRLLIYGSRTWAPSVFEIEAVFAWFFARGPGAVPPVVATLVSGNARGADRAGEAWAAAREIAIERYPADWHTYGNRAGPIRNALMATKCSHAIGFRDDGESRGTDDMTANLVRRATPHRVVTRDNVYQIAKVTP